MNVLVRAFRREASEHDRYALWLQHAISEHRLLLSDAVRTGFARVVTNTRILSAPSTIGEAMEFLTVVREHATIASGTRIWQTYAALCAGDPGVRGNLVPDAYLAATALSYGARVATKDRGFARFPGVSSFDPAAVG